jgi:hypothetical protein
MCTNASIGQTLYHTALLTTPRSLNVSNNMTAEILIGFSSTMASTVALKAAFKRWSHRYERYWQHTAAVLPS